jgi:hypothetical protein
MLAVRTGGLLAGIIVHIGFDVPLDYAAVCRLPSGGG